MSMVVVVYRVHVCVCVMQVAATICMFAGPTYMCCAGQKRCGAVATRAGSRCGVCASGAAAESHRRGTECSRDLCDARCGAPVCVCGEVSRHRPRQVIAAPCYVAMVCAVVWAECVVLQSALLLHSTTVVIEL